MNDKNTEKEVRASRLLALSRAEEWAGELKKHVEQFEQLMREQVGPKSLALHMGVVRSRRSAQAWYAACLGTEHDDPERQDALASSRTWEYSDATAQSDAMWAQADAIHRNAEKVARLADRLCASLTTAYPAEEGQPDEVRCPECGGLGGGHSPVHERYPEGGSGFNRLCSRAGGESK